MLLEGHPQHKRCVTTYTNRQQSGGKSLTQLPDNCQKIL